MPKAKSVSAESAEKDVRQRVGSDGIFISLTDSVDEVLGRLRVIDRALEGIVSNRDLKLNREDLAAVHRDVCGTLDMLGDAKRAEVELRAQEESHAAAGVDLDAVRKAVRLLDDAGGKAHRQLLRVTEALAALIKAADEGAEESISAGLREILEGLHTRCRQAGEESDALCTDGSGPLRRLIGDW